VTWTPINAATWAVPAVLHSSQARTVALASPRRWAAMLRPAGPRTSAGSIPVAAVARWAAC